MARGRVDQWGEAGIAQEQGTGSSVLANRVQG